MGDSKSLSIKVAAHDHDGLEEALRSRLPDADVERYSDYRDFSILEVVYGGVASGAVAVAVEVVKDWVKERLASRRSTEERAISIKIGDVSITIEGDADGAEVERLFERLRGAPDADPRE